MNLLFGTPFTVSTHSRPKAAGTNFIAWARAFVFQLTAARRRLVNMEARQKGAEAVSTHSRPKAAGWIRKQQALALKRFNSQPPEGGWDDGEVVIVGQQFRFNSQPPEGGWRIQYFSTYNAAMFQLTAARRRLVIVVPLLCASKLRFNSQPPEGGWKKGCGLGSGRICFNSQPPEGGWQHFGRGYYSAAVSTHSRPKAAGGNGADCRRDAACFNSQPPEGGWSCGLRRRTQ